MSPAGIKTTLEAARLKLQDLVKNSHDITRSRKETIQIVRGLQNISSLPAKFRTVAVLYEQALQDPKLRAAVYRVLDQRNQSRKQQINRWRNTLRFKGNKAPNNGRRRPPRKFSSH